MWARDAQRTPLFWGKGKAKYFRAPDWTDEIRLRLFENFDFPRKRFSAYDCQCQCDRGHSF
jgi:hypothetical protein